MKIALVGLALLAAFAANEARIEWTAHQFMKLVAGDE